MSKKAARLLKKCKNLLTKTQERERLAYKLAKAHKNMFLPKQTNSSEIADVNAHDFIGSLNSTEYAEANRKRRLTENEIEQLRNLENLYWKSFDTLEKVFNQEFTQSKTFKDMVLMLNQNMVEYKFMR